MVAAGAWSGALLEAATGDAAWGAAFRGRRGHLLECATPGGMRPLKHGLMEATYSKVRPSAAMSSHAVESPSRISLHTCSTSAASATAAPPPLYRQLLSPGGLVAARRSKCVILWREADG